MAHQFPGILFVPKLGINCHADAKTYDRGYPQLRTQLQIKQSVSVSIEVT